MAKVLLDRTRAHQVYLTSGGKQVPGVTSILDVLNDGDKGALMHWAWQMGMEKKDYRKVKDQAADVGTIAHFLIECFLTNKRPDLSMYSKRDIVLATGCLKQFMEWWKKGGYIFVNSELQLVSDKHKYGGTIDIVAKRKGRTALLDLKTSKGIYSKYWYQVAAYANLMSEKKKAPKEHTIVRIGKDGSFEVESREDVSAEWEIFSHLIPLYYKVKQYKTR